MTPSDEEKDEKLTDLEEEEEECEDEEEEEEEQGAVEITLPIGVSETESYRS